MSYYRSYFNGSKVVQGQVKRRADVQPPVAQTGGAVVELKKVPGPAKELDKKAVRLKMAQEVMRNL